VEFIVTGVLLAMSGGPCPKERVLTDLGSVPTVGDEAGRRSSPQSVQRKTRRAGRAALIRAWVQIRPSLGDESRERPTSYKQPANHGKER
jgi:hypothetical protein